MKTAFITSLVGMAAAILFRLISILRALFSRKNNTNEDISVEPRDILNAISTQSEHLKELKLAISGGEESSLASQLKLLRSDANDNHREHLKEIKLAISGDEDSSLSSQLKLVRSEANDNHSQNSKTFETFSAELWKNLDKVSEMLSKSATEQIIEALRNVIQDFNEKLTEQFGDNFKALDASVTKLVTWQDQYSEQLNEMIKQYAQGVLAISAIETSVTSIGKEAKAIPETMAQLKPVLDTNQHQINELSNHLNAFKEIKEQAVSAFPEIQKHVENTVLEISKSSDKASEGYQLLVEKTSTVQSSFEQQIDKIQKQLESTVTSLIEKQMQEMQKHFNELEQSVENTAKKSGEITEGQIKRIDDTLSKEISAAMSQMGGNLVSITGKFVEDYTDLVNAMKKVTQQSTR